MPKSIPQKSISFIGSKGLKNNKIVLRPAIMAKIEQYYLQNTNGIEAALKSSTYYFSFVNFYSFKKCLPSCVIIEQRCS